MRAGVPDLSVEGTQLPGTGCRQDLATAYRVGVPRRAGGRVAADGHPTRRRRRPHRVCLRPMAYRRCPRPAHGEVIALQVDALDLLEHADRAGAPLPWPEAR